MTTGQLPLFEDRPAELPACGYDWRLQPHPNMEAFRALDLKPAVFHWTLRELAAGRPAPRPLTAAQLDYVRRWLP